ncbi:hypothetical protein B4U80_13864 [Leptotrombidium deliense]|uniref:Uncharacterized protein n=1 Tax=Leptotrombidium deliense TaxID=299467 RepID=A0A443SAI2_9ACAR|nr:hypothetical protein B4U80_13864 [Leptotrombidium deliense]
MHLTTTISIEFPNHDQVMHYHFHTHFMQNNAESVRYAMVLRKKVGRLIKLGYLEQCSITCDLCDVIMSPKGEFTVAMFMTCCNKTSVANAIEFFTMKRGNLSVLIHPVTIHAIEDNTHRAMWLGPSFPLDLSWLPVIRNAPLTCFH